MLRRSSIFVAPVLVLLVLCGGILLCYGGVPNPDQYDSTFSSAFIAMSIETSLDGNQWTPLASNYYAPIPDELPHAEVQALLDAEPSPPELPASPYTTYVYQVHPLPDTYFRINVQNLSAYRLKVVVSLDDFNFLGAEPVRRTESSDRGWILDPGETSTITGWKYSASQALGFIFTMSEGLLPGNPPGVPVIRADVYLPDQWNEVRSSLLDYSAGYAGYPTTVVTLADIPAVRRDELEVCFQETPTGNLVYLVPEQTLQQLHVGMGPMIGFNSTPAFFASLTEQPIETISVYYSAEIQAFLGVSVSAAGAFGVIIEYVIPGTPAMDAGLQVGQMISKINGSIVRSVQEFKQLLSAAAPGSIARLTVHDNSGAYVYNLDVPLGAW